MSGHAKQLADAMHAFGEFPVYDLKMRAARDALYDAAGEVVAEIRAASEALDALGVAPGSLAERVRALGEERDRLRADNEAQRFRAVEAEAAAFDASEAPMTAALPDLGIVAAHGDTAQALAEDVASQVLHVVQSYALADPESLAPDAQALRARVRARLGFDEDDRLTPSERARLEAQATPATCAFLAAMREMRRTGDTTAGLEAFQTFLAETMPRAATPPPEPDLEPAVGDGPEP